MASKPSFDHDPNLDTLAWETARKYGLDENLFVAVIECESEFNPLAVGDSGTSFGIAQFHKPVSDWGITIEQAYDPAFSLDLMARTWVRGEASRWTCYRLLK